MVLQIRLAYWARTYSSPPERHNIDTRRRIEQSFNWEGEEKKKEKAPESVRGNERKAPGSVGGLTRSRIVLYFVELSCCIVLLCRAKPDPRTLLYRAI